jgi:Flp pilus assembly pilin Flp
VYQKDPAAPVRSTNPPISKVARQIMTRLMNFLSISRWGGTLQNLRDSRRAVTSIEYIIMASLIALVIVGSLTLVGQSMPTKALNTISDEL